MGISPELRAGLLGPQEDSESCATPRHSGARNERSAAADWERAFVPEESAAAQVRKTHLLCSGVAQDQTETGFAGSDARCPGCAAFSCAPSASDNRSIPGPIFSGATCPKLNRKWLQG